MLDKTKKYLWAIKLVFGLALLFFIVWKVWNDPVLADLKSISFTGEQIILIVVVCALMPLNWLLESSKFKFLMSSTQYLSWKGSLLSVLAGLSTGLLTPNRIGNFIGRNIYVSPHLKRKAVFVTLESNLAQFLSTAIFGVIGLAIIGMERFDVPAGLLESLTAVIIILGFLFYIRPGFLLKIIPGKLVGEKSREAILNINDANLEKKMAALFISLLRYAVYIIQYYLLLSAFYQPLDFFEILPAMMLVFLITTLIPSFLFGKLFVREASALLVLTTFGIPSAVILLSAFLLWFINLAIPSLIGAWVLIRKT